MSVDLANSGHICSQGATLWLLCDVGTPFYALKSLLRSFRAIFGSDFGLALFWQIQVVFMVREPLGDVGTPSRALISLLRVIQLK